MNPKDQLAEIEKEIKIFLEGMWQTELTRQVYKKRRLPLSKFDNEEQYKRRIYVNDVCGPLLKLKWKKQGFLLGTISQLKIRLEELEPYVDFMDVSNEDNTKTSEIKLKLIKEGYDKIDEISSDLKFYEDKLKELGE